MLGALTFAVALLSVGLLAGWALRDRVSTPRATQSRHAQNAGNELLKKIFPLHDEVVSWDSLSKQLSTHHVVLVTGPQRSGTTWVACALASHLGYKLYDERHPITGGNDTLVALERAFAYARQQPVRRMRGERTQLCVHMGRPRVPSRSHAFAMPDVHGR